jgi:MOSC domain-containing protein YiiM
MRTTRTLRHVVHGPWGDSSRHLPLAELEAGLAKLSPPKDAGRLELIVARSDDGRRQTPERTRLSPEEGVPGDAWLRDAPDETHSQITMMRADVARLVANGQPLSLSGDNLIVDLDLSVENLPVGSRIELGEALLEVTPEPHDGCLKFRQRFGKDALRLTAQRRPLRLRGVHLEVVRAGEVAVGDLARVVSRGRGGPPVATG